MARVAFCVLIKWLVAGVLRKLQGRRHQSCDQRVETFCPILNLQGAEWLEIELITNSQQFHQSCLCNATSNKTLTDGIWRASRLVNTWRCWTGGTAGESGGSSKPFLNPCPSTSSFSYSCACCIVNQECQHLSSQVLQATPQVMDHEEGSWEPLTYCKVG